MHEPEITSARFNELGNNDYDRSMVCGRLGRGQIGLPGNIILLSGF